LGFFADRSEKVQFTGQQLKMLEKHYIGQVAKTDNIQEFCS